MSFASPQPFDLQSSLPTNEIITHPVLGDLQVFEDINKTRILRCKIDLSQSDPQEKTYLQCLEELNHPNILSFDGMTSRPEGESYGFFEYFSNTLLEEIENRAKYNKKYTEKEIIGLLQDISSALAYLQRNKISYGKVRSDTIVKVDSKYKLLSPVLLEKYNNLDDNSSSSNTNSSYVSSLQSIDPPDTVYPKIYDSAHKRYRNDILDFGKVVLSAMTLLTVTTIPLSSQRAIATSYYSPELIVLVGKMVETIISLRMDCISFENHVQDLVNQVSNSLSASHKRRASSANSRAFSAQTEQKSLLEQVERPSRPLPVRHSKTPTRLSRDLDTSSAYMNPVVFAQSYLSNYNYKQQPSSFGDILKDALPSQETKETFNSNMPSTLFETGDNYNLLSKTFSVKSQRDSKEKNTEVSVDIHNISQPIKNDSFASGTEAHNAKKSPLDSYLTKAFQSKSSKDLRNNTAGKLQHQHRHIDSNAEVQNARRAQSSMKAKELTKPKRAKIPTIPLNLTMDEPAQFSRQEEIYPLSHKSSATIQGRNTVGGKMYDEKPETSGFYHKHDITEKPGKRLQELRTELSVLEGTWKDHSTDYLTNASSARERISPHYGFLTSRSRYNESPNLTENGYFLNQNSLHNSKLHHSTFKPEANTSQPLSHKQWANDERLPSFGDELRQSHLEIPAMNESNDEHRRVPITPKSDLSASRRQMSTPHRPTVSNRSPMKSTIQYFTEVYPDGSVYQGEGFSNNIRHGVGRLNFADGSCYEGEWKHDNMEGFGVMFYPNGTIAYEGEWQNNKCNGKGVLYNDRSSAMPASYPKNLLGKDEKSWQRYEGGFCNDRWEGEGKLVFVNGDEFCGDFVNDLIHGFGKFITNAGVVYEGEWANNRLIKVNHQYSAEDLEPAV